MHSTLTPPPPLLRDDFTPCPETDTRRSTSEVYRALLVLERLPKRRQVCGSGRISARKSAAEDAALHAAGKDYSNGGGDYRHKEYFWTKALIGVFVSTLLHAALTVSVQPLPASVNTLHRTVWSTTARPTDTSCPLRRTAPPRLCKGVWVLHWPAIYWHGAFLPEVCMRHEPSEEHIS